MKVFKIVIQALILLVALIAVIGWVLPRKTTIERAIDVNTPVDPVYKILITPTESIKWSPWAKIDPEGTQWTFEGPDAGEGAIMKWASDHSKVGSGTQTWQTCIHNKEVITKLEFDAFKDPSYATFIFDEFDGYTEVTWQFEVDYGSNPFMHYFTFLTESHMGPIFEEGLLNLKEYIESKHIHEEELDIELQGDALVDSLSHLEQ